MHGSGRQNVSTPHTDRLIRSGIQFTQWISAAPICTPSRAALQTGRYPIRTGCMGDEEKFRVIPTPSNPHGNLDLFFGAPVTGFLTHSALQ